MSGTMCTRFATEISLRYSAAESITGHAFISPYAKNPSQSHRVAVESFQRDITSLDAIPTLMDEARKAMGLAEASGISRDVLHLRLEGKRLPNLTLVDLPGLIHASANTDDVSLVRGLIQEYFKQQQSIILIVVSAENPTQNQGILDYSRKFDPKGTRSIGVLTKPDVLDRPDKVSLKPAMLELARNQHPTFKFTRGWHVVRCLNDKERADGLDRDLLESTLFSREQWKNTFHPKHLGIKSLRLILSKYLHEHILQVLPGLQTSLEKGIQDVKSSLERLGDARTSSKERMRYLIRISKRYGELVRDALEGDYSDVFFKDGDPAKRLRAQTMGLTDDYDQSMRTKGHSFDIRDEQPRIRHELPNNPEIITQSDALLKVGKLLEAYRGPELSFLFNPRLVGELFKEQSQKWRLLTSEYIGKVSCAVDTFLNMVISFICPSTGDTANLVFQHVLQDTLQKSLKSLDSKAQELFSPYTTSFLFSTKKRLQASLKNIELQALQKAQDEAGPTTKPRQQSGPQIMGSDHDTRVKLLQYSAAYYDVAIETFIDNVVLLGVESCLLSKLEAMFTSEIVVQMDEKTLDLVGGESLDMQSERKALNEQLETLEVSLKRCRKHTSRINWGQFKETHPIPPKEPVSSQFGQAEDSGDDYRGGYERRYDNGYEDGSEDRAKGNIKQEESDDSGSTALQLKPISNGVTAAPVPSRLPSALFADRPIERLSSDKSSVTLDASLSSTQEIRRPKLPLETAPWPWGNHRNPAGAQGLSNGKSAAAEFSFAAPPAAPALSNREQQSELKFHFPAQVAVPSPLSTTSGKSPSPVPVSFFSSSKPESTTGKSPSPASTGPIGQFRSESTIVKSPFSASTALFGQPKSESATVTARSPSPAAPATAQGALKTEPEASTRCNRSEVGSENEEGRTAA